MIPSDEIRDHANRVQLANTVVEKDYALGWLLAGIHQHPATKENWIFKGGTCLKKCYFETYRFSEDLDFSFRGKNEPTIKDLIQIFSEISDWVMETSGLEFPKETIKFEIFKNPRDTNSIQGRIAYRGPIRPGAGISNLPRIKIDLTLDEPLQLPPTLKAVDHPYSDTPPNGFKVFSYDYEEVFAEKVRALAQRLRPRDLYDVVHLHRRLDLNPSREKVILTLQKKCELRNVIIPTIASIQDHENRALLESEWEGQLKHQIPILPTFKSFLDELPAFFDWLHRIDETEVLESIATSNAEEEVSIISESVTTLVLPGPHVSFLDRIRFAAANRLEIRLGYDGSYRNIESYALARSSDGFLLLRAIRSDGESRTYRFDRMESVTVTETSFTPRYVIEITSAGHLPIHQLNRQPTSQRPTRSSGGMKYVFQCSVCRKTFKRKTMDATLKPHQNKQGQICYGTYGVYLRIEN